MKLLLKQVTVSGNPRMPLLAPEAASSLISIIKEMPGLAITDMWRDATASMLAKRLGKSSTLPGYCAHNYGLAIEVDLSTAGVEYQDFIKVMRKHGWVCQRQDREKDKPGSNQFNFFGEDAGRFLADVTFDPATWQAIVEKRIFEKYGDMFQYPLTEVQERLTKIGLYRGKVSGESDLYTREAILEFQRTWKIQENGIADNALCRVLAFITAEIKLS